MSIKQYIWDRAIPRYRDLGIPLLYRLACRAPVNRRLAVFVDAGHGYAAGYARVGDYLQRECGFELATIRRADFDVQSREARRRGRTALRTLAQARFVFLQSESGFIGRLPIRRGTTVVQLWHACGAFKKVGADLARVRGQEPLDYRRFYGNPDVVCVSSPEVVGAYVSCMGLDATPQVVRPLGNPRTDVFFDQAFVQGARARLEEQLPQVRGKRTILYAPTFRNAGGGRTAPDYLDYEACRAELAPDSVLLVRQHPDLRAHTSVPAGCEGFVVPANDVEMELLLCATDVLVTDYSSILFEFALFDRPMAFFAPDLEEFGGDERFFYPYRPFVPGPVFGDSSELAAWLARAEQLCDPAQVEAFRARFMSSCDGHATERVCRTLVEEF